MTLTEMSDNEEEERDFEDQVHLLPLQPFAHQVGGHSCLMLYNKSTVCKPLRAKEYEFYMHMPEELKPFTPQYKGVTEVIIEKASTGTLHCYALPNLWCPSKEALQIRKDDISKHHSDDVHHNCGDSLCVGQKWVKKSKEHTESHTCEACSQPRLPSDISNPWTKEVLWRLWNKVPCEKRVMETFILLENVAMTYKRPCVLDLKMGTRQHSEDASPEKIHRRIKRVQFSTSGSLGTRLCGMKVYNPEEKSYIFVDKYQGRVMDRQELESSLKQFFTKNTKLRIGLVENCLAKLSSLTTCLKRLQDYRFYSSSLLMIYDACGRDCTVDVRIIDFANISSNKDDLDVRSCDEGFIFGLKNLLYLLEELLEEFKCENGESV